MSPAARWRGPLGGSTAEAERLIARLRVLAIPIFALAERISHPDPERTAFYLVLALFALYAVAMLVWTSRQPPHASLGLLATGADVAAVAALAALSGGAFSPARSAFFALPVLVAFRFRPPLTATAAVATLLAYLVQALAHPSANAPQAGTEIAVRGSFLAWIGLSATLLSTLLERRTRSVVELSSASEQLEARYRGLFHGVPLGLFRLDADGRLLEANPALLEVLGAEVADGAGLPDLPFPAGDGARWRRLAEEGRLRGVEFETAEPGGEARWLRTTGRAVRDGRGGTVAYEGSLEDVTDRRRAEEGLAAHARRQAIVAELARASLRSRDLDAFLAQVVAAVADTLGVAFCKVLECRPGEPELLLRAGVGWQEGLVGHARVSADRGSQAGFTLVSGQPVVTDDLDRERRFLPPPLLVDHGVRSGASVVIGGLDAPYGVLGVHAAAPHRFSDDEVHFLQAVAGLLASTIERGHADAALAETRERFSEARRRLLADALTAEERERQLLAESLHDHAIQSLLAARQDVQDAAAGTSGALERAGGALAETIRDLREAIFELDPRVYVQAGFEPALRAAALRAARRGRFDLRIAIAEGPYRHERLLLGVARQVLANAAQHSGAGRVWLRLARREAAVVLTIADDGHGFRLDELPGKVAAGHIGLASHRERVESAGGTFRIRSAPGSGTTVRVRLPL